MPRFDPAELAIHHAKHGADFMAATDTEYERLAEQFLLTPFRPGLIECKRKRGDIVRYDEITQEFAVLSAVGVIRTYFKPVPCASLPRGVPKVGCHGMRDNLQYFNTECSK